MVKASLVFTGEMRRKANIYIFIYLFIFIDMYLYIIVKFSYVAYTLLLILINIIINFISLLPLIQRWFIPFHSISFDSFSFSVLSSSLSVYLSTFLRFCVSVFLSFFLVFFLAVFVVVRRLLRHATMACYGHFISALFLLIKMLRWEMNPMMKWAWTG